MHFESFSNTFCQKVWQDTLASLLPRVGPQSRGCATSDLVPWAPEGLKNYGLPTHHYGTFPYPFHAVSERIRTELVLFYPNPTRKYLTLSENTRKSTISALTQRALSLNIMRFSVRAMNCRINSYRYRYTNSNLPEVFLTKSPSF